MAKSLGLSTVAEGVETESQWQYLKSRTRTRCKASYSVGRWPSRIWSAGMPSGCTPQKRAAPNDFAAWASRASTRAMTNSRSDSRFKYCSASGATSSAPASDQQRRSARRHTERATWQCGGGGSAARQNEVLERRQVFVERIEFVLRAVRHAPRDHAVPGMQSSPPRSNRSCCTSVRQRRTGSRQRRLGQHHADAAVGFIDAAVGLDPQAVLGHARAVAQAGAAVIARARIDLAEPVAHDDASSTLAPSRNCGGP
jgi:hypothetical protein